MTNLHGAKGRSWEGSRGGSGQDMVGSGSVVGWSCGVYGGGGWLEAGSWLGSG